jgi:NADH dehydrogenase (ubiquinone) 1 alpha subcomplex subunit 2
MKKDNPTFPILIRECSGIEAKVWARYDLGKEASVKVENMTAADIKTQLQGLIEKGATMPRAQ